MATRRDAPGEESCVISEYVLVGCGGVGWGGVRVSRWECVYCVCMHVKCVCTVCALCMVSEEGRRDRVKMRVNEACSVGETIQV